MRHPFIVWLLTLPFVLLLSAAAGDGCARGDRSAEAVAAAAETVVPEAEAAAVRLAVERSLPYLETEGVAWMEEQKCVSCHQIPMMIWSLQAAADHGLAVDEAKLEGWTRWTLERSRGVESDNHDGINHLILGRPRRDASLEAEFLTLSRFVLDHQQAGGTWKAGGQLPLQRRPAEESHRVSTAWSVLALETAGAESEALASAHAHLAEWQPESGESLEWLLVRLLLARQQNSESAEDFLMELLTAQRGDGGWSWRRGEASDALATGQVLYTLAQLSPTDPSRNAALARGRDYLLRTQSADGSWPTHSTLQREEGITPTSTYWATGWAVVGLLENTP